MRPTIAAMDPARLEAAFKERPALHRFPANMARRTQDLCAAIARDFGGDASRVWPRPRTAGDLERRLLEPARHRRDEGQDADRDPGQAPWRPAARLGGRRAAAHDAGRRRLAGRSWPSTRPASAPTRHSPRSGGRDKGQAQAVSRPQRGSIRAVGADFGPGCGQGSQPGLIGTRVRWPNVPERELASSARMASTTEQSRRSEHQTSLPRPRLGISLRRQD